MEANRTAPPPGRTARAARLSRAMPRRLRRLPTLPVRLDGMEVRVAATARARLLGLAGLRAGPPCGLLLPRTRSVHTFGMRFPLDLVWLNAHGRTVRVDMAVPPRRLRRCAAACAVVELPSREERAGPEPGPALTTDD
jgi:uncharacterized membrane protein (UPF0127 family)